MIVSLSYDPVKYQAENMKRAFLVFLFTIGVLRLSAGADLCGITNTAFTSGESISFRVFYSVVGLYFEAGSATFTANRERLNNKPVYHITGLGYSNARYDWIFKVRDKYESYVDTLTLRPYKFVRNVDEGGYKKFELVNFDHDRNQAVSQKGSYAVPVCVQDVLSAIYYARNIDFSRYKPGDKIPLTIFLDDEVHNIYVRYMGKEEIRTRYGRFRSIKFKPMLIKGTIFEGGEKMTVWVTDDLNKVPLRIESPITVGSVKVDMMGYKNLRHPMNAMISVR